MGLDQPMANTVDFSPLDDINSYESFFNPPPPPNFTTMLTIMYGNRYWLELKKHYGLIEHLKEPHAVSMLDFLNSFGSKPVDDGPYDVLQVLLKADAGSEEW